MNDQTIQPEPDAHRKRPGIAPITCDEVLDLIPALALGAIETGPAQLVRLHCGSCLACANELAESERVTLLLPFSAPPRAPSAGARFALMERINTAVPTMVGGAALASPIIDSPVAKRRSGYVDSGRANDLFDWTRDLVSGKTMRLAAAPIALALVIVSLYNLGTFDASTGDGTLAPTAQAAASEVNASIGPANDVQLTLLSAGTSGATVTQPSAVTGDTLGSSFMARSNRSLAQTELLRTVAPTFAECSIQKGASGTWHVEVSGVSLSDLDEPADVFLVSKTGQMVEVGDVSLDHNGNGVVSFTLDQPMSEFSLLRIGSNPTDVSGVGSQEHYTFQIDLAARLSQGLSRPD